MKPSAKRVDDLFHERRRVHHRRIALDPMRRQLRTTPTDRHVASRYAHDRPRAGIVMGQPSSEVVGERGISDLICLFHQGCKGIVELRRTQLFETDGRRGSSCRATPVGTFRPATSRGQVEKPVQGGCAGFCPSEAPVCSLEGNRSLGDTHRVWPTGRRRPNEALIEVNDGFGFVGQMPFDRPLCGQIPRAQSSQTSGLAPAPLVPDSYGATPDASRPGAAAPGPFHCGTSGEATTAAVKGPLRRPLAALDCRFSWGRRANKIADTNVGSDA